MPASITKRQSWQVVCLAALILMLLTFIPSDELQARQNGDPYADQVVSFTPGNPASQCCNNPESALGPPDFNEAASSGWVTLGVGGSITLEFSDNVIINQDGPDIEIFGDPYNDEQWTVEVSSDGVNYRSFGLVGERSSLDLAAVGLDSVRFVRITDDGSSVEGGISPGAELDAVQALHAIPTGTPLSQTMLPTPLPASPSTEGGTQLSNQTWVRLGGPLGGLGYDIRMDPRNPDVMYVTDSGAGAFKSTDGGRSWSPINNGIDTRTGPSGDLIPVFSLTIDPNNPDRLWAGTQFRSGVFRSDDGGQKWTHMGNGISEDDLAVRGFTVEPGNTDIVYFAAEVPSHVWNGRQTSGPLNLDRTRGVVYKSLDAGQHWNRVWAGDNLARYIWINPQDTEIIYVSTGIFDRHAANSTDQQPGGIGILKSIDGGQNWQVLNEAQGLTGLYVGSLFMHPKNPDHLLAGAGHDYWSGNGASPGGAFLSVNGGASWLRTLSEPIYSVEICVNNPDIAYAANTGAIYRSQDSGQTWERVSGSSQGSGYWGPAGIVAGFPIDIQCDPRDPNRLFVNNYGGGNFLSEDGGRTWVDASRGYSGAPINGGLAISRDDYARIYAGGRSGLFLSDDGGTSWSGLAYSPARYTEITALAASPSNSALILSAPWDLGNLARSSNSGVNWEIVFLPKPPNLQILSLAFAPSDPQVIFLGIGRHGCKMLTQACEGDGDGGGIYVSDDAGKSWDPANDNQTGTLNIASIAVHPADVNTVYVAALFDGIYKSTNRGAAWQHLNLPRRVLSVAIDSQNPETVFAGTVGGIFRSQDGGMSWVDASYGMNPEAQVRAIVLNPVDSQNLWAADYANGAYFSTDGGQSWHQHNDGLTVRAVTDLAISQDGLTLYASTTGGGVFRLSTHSLDEFNALSPATPANTSTDDQAPTPAPASGSPFEKLPCGSALILLGLVWRLRRR